jgi:hypothetical protein
MSIAAVRSWVACGVLWAAGSMMASACAPAERTERVGQDRAGVFDCLTAGSYPVGFRVMRELDTFRIALPPRAGFGRAVPIAVWYPSAPSDSPPMTLREYVIASEQTIVGGPIDDAAAIAAFVTEARTRGAALDGIERLLNARGLARRDAPPSARRFPLVMFAHASVDTQSVMAEYLASYGYVVAAVRSRGAQDVAYRLSRENLDAMVADIDFAARRLQREHFVAPDPIGVIGMSNGSIAAVALQLKRSDIGAVVSLDGGIGEDAGGIYLNERSEQQPTKFTAPVLHLYSTDNAHLNLSYLRAYQMSPRWLISVRGMRHQDFLAYPAFDRITDGFSGRDATPDSTAGFTWTNRYVLHFLDAHLRHTRHGASFIETPTAKQKGLPAGLLSLEHIASAQP